MASSSITTKRGDHGETDLLFGGRVGKSHPRLHAVGEVDELNAALGLARQHVRNARLPVILHAVQQDLVAVMGLLSAGPEQAERYRSQGFQDLAPARLEALNEFCQEMEGHFPDGFKGWSMPGEKGGPGAAWLELARCICRRAERSLVSLPVPDAPAHPVLLPWINRLSDFLWLAARLEEKPEA